MACIRNMMARMYCLSVVLLFVGGFVLNCIGIARVRVASLFDPSTDFESMNGGCNISAVSFVKDYSSGKGGCVNQFNYEFTTPSYGSAVYIAPKDEHCGEAFCPCGPENKIEAAKHQAGDQLPCWEPAAGKTKADVKFYHRREYPYKCENHACIKIVNPQIEYDGKTEGSIVFQAPGMACCMVGCCLCCCFLTRSNKQESPQESPEESPQESQQQSSDPQENGVEPYQEVVSV